LIDSPAAPGDEERRRRARRTAIVLGLIAIGFYASFIAMSVMRSRH